MKRRACEYGDSFRRRLQALEEPSSSQMSGIDIDRSRPKPELGEGPLSEATKPGKTSSAFVDRPQRLPVSYPYTMSADSIIYCLERVSDYRDFERLCSAFLASAGYPRIDPLGGTGDEGRDAIVRSDEAGRKIGFAYTVRSDWRVKLASDCKRVHEKGHAPDVFVSFVQKPCQHRRRTSHTGRSPRSTVGRSTCLILRG